MKFLLLFLLAPLIEVAVFIQVGAAIGAVWVVLATIITAILGIGIIRSQGLVTLSRVRDELMGGKAPTVSIIEGAFMLFSGIMLFTPGLITDFIGLVCLIPTVRFYLIRKLMALKPAANHFRSESHSNTSNVIDGQYTKED